MCMESMIETAAARFESCNGIYTKEGVERAIVASIERKSKLNEILGLDVENDFTLTLPLEASEHDIRRSYPFTNSLILRFLEFLYYNIDYSISNNQFTTSRSSQNKLTRLLAKHETTVKSSELFVRSLEELSLEGARSTKSFQDFVCRLGELKNTGGNELFITSSIVEMWGVNWNSAYRSCLRHKNETDTSYFTGTSAFGMDPFTLLVGVRRKKDKYKLGRSWLHLFSDGVDSSGKDFKVPFMIQNKSYGEFETTMREKVREMIQTRIDQFVGNSHSWISGRLDCMEETHVHGYVDNSELTVAYPRKSGVTKPSRVVVNFSKEVPCVKCGKVVIGATNGTSLCDDCQDEYYCRCHDCNTIITYKKDAKELEGAGKLCHSCFSNRFFTCACCDKTFDMEESVDAIIEGRSRRICKGCMEESFVMCAICENAHYADKVKESVEGRSICEACSEGYCDSCGRYFEPDSVSYDGTNEEEAYCEACNATMQQAA